MRWAVAHPDEAAAIGRAGQALAQRRLTRDVAVDVIAERLAVFTNTRPAVQCAPEQLRPVIQQAIAQAQALA